MFVPPPDLSSDLDWMLASGQVSRENLVEALVREYYPQVLQFSLAMFDDPHTASRVARRTFTLAMTNLYRYRSESGVKTWIFANALESFQHERKRRADKIHLRVGRKRPARISSAISNHTFGADITELEKTVDRMSDGSHLPLILRFLFNWHPEEISLLTKFSWVNNIGELGEAWELLEPAFAVAQLNTRSNQERLLSRYLEWRWPTQRINAQHLDRISMEITRRSNWEVAQRKIISSFKEAVWILVAALLVGAFIWGYNRFFPEPNLDAATQPSQAVEKGVLQALPTVTKSVSSIETFQAQVAAGLASTPKATPTPSGVFYYVQPGDTLLSIADTLGIPAAILTEFNRLPPGIPLEPSQLIAIPPRNPSSHQQTPLPVPTQSQIPSAEIPEGTDEILAFLRNSRLSYHTFWMDAYIIRYGPEGYIGAPEIERIQAWHSADQLLVLNGFVPEQLNEVLLNTSEAAYLAMPGRDKPWFEELDNVEDPPIKLGENLEFLFDKLYSVSWLGNSIDMKIVGEERIAERKVWIVAVTGNGKLVKRLWVDCLTGRILRYQEFYENNPNLVENEFDTHAIEYDVDFPQELFDPSLPWRGGFARDHTGAPLLPTGQQDVQAFEDRELLPLTIKPPDFNPALSQLSIQLPSFFSTENGEGGADLFSDRYYIGTITFDDPWNAVCDRSTDGRMLALATNQSSSPVQGASLRWYDLSKDNFKEHNFRLAYTNQFAFSPDGNQLAIFGYNNPKDSGWIFVLDTRTQVFHRLMRVEYVRSLAWSPDGTQLAFIGSGRNFLSDEDIIILNIESEKVTYRASIDFLTGNGDNDWPMTDWGIEFPVEMKNLAECVKPPT